MEEKSVVEKLKQNLREIGKRPLSDGDIREFLDSSVPILTYPELKNYRHIDEILDKKGRAVILYLTESPTSGHWVGLLRRGKTIEFFDPYGNPVDTQQEKLGEGIPNKEFGQDMPILRELLAGSGYKVIQNRHPFQRDSKDINTCGRWVISRLAASELSLPEFKKFVDSSGLTGDDFVSLFTAMVLGE